MGAITRESILKSEDLKPEAVQVPEWDGEVLVRGLMGHERDSFEQSLYVGEDDDRRFDPSNIRARLLVRCIVDESGDRIFTDADAPALGQRNATALDRCYKVAQRLSGMGNGELDRAAKN